MPPMTSAEFQTLCQRLKAQDITLTQLALDNNKIDAMVFY
jgi:hypothetical protein